MLVFRKIYLIITFINILLVTSAESDYYNWKFLNGTEIIQPNYCDDVNCIVKCCPNQKMIRYVDGVDKCRKIRPSLINQVNFSSIYVYDKNNVSTNVNLQSKFVFLYIESFFNNSYQWIPDEPPMIFEDGSMKMKDDIKETKLRFCVDFLFKPGRVPSAIFVFRTIKNDDPEAWKKQLFVATGMLISCFFFLLVLLVYGLLPSVRGGLWGVILMTYIVTAMITFSIKATQNILTLTGQDGNDCFNITAVMYYFILSHFFWSNVLSYHMWYKLANPTSRSTIKSRKSIGKLDLKEKRKYLWYSLYAFGVPASMTGLIVIVDRYKLYATRWLKPPFDDCLFTGGSVKYYMFIPVGTMLGLNIIFFVLTACYIWFVERNMNNVKGTKTTKSQKSRIYIFRFPHGTIICVIFVTVAQMFVLRLGVYYDFFLYLKISVLMGIAWLIELLPTEQLSLPLFALSVFYNVFTGVIVFIILVCKKSIFVALCKKFGIMEQYVQKHQNYSSSRHSSTKTTTTRRPVTNVEDKAAEESFV